MKKLFTLSITLLVTMPLLATVDLRDDSTLPTLIFAVILAFLIFEFLLEQFLDFLNYKKLNPELPKELSSIYDKEKYQKSQEYEKVRAKFGLIKSIFSFITLVVFLMCSGFGYVDVVARQFSGNQIIVALLFFAIIGIASDIIALPFEIYATFVIEERFGFNKTTPKLFILDKIKGYVLGAIVGGALLSLIIWIYSATQEMFWIYAWIAVSGFTIFFTMFYSTLIVPLFNKQTPLPEGELRSEIEKFSTKVGFKLDNVFEIDGSKRSTKANAYFSGFGSKKRIVLYDTLINEMSTEEIVAVLAHEIGHYKKRHILSGMALGIVQTGAILFIFSRFVGSWELSEALGAEQSFHIALVAFGMLFTPINLFIGLAMNIFSRKNEFQADAFARDNYNGEALASALKKLSVKNLSNLTPHPLYVFFHYSHPPVLERLEKLSIK